MRAGNTAGLTSGPWVLFWKGGGEFNISPWRMIDPFDIVQPRIERDWDYAEFQGQGLDWFSRSGARLFTYREPAGDLITYTNSRVLSNFVVKTSENTYGN